MSRQIWTFFFWSKKDSNYLDVNLKVFQRDDNRLFRLVQNLTIGGTDFKQFMRLRHQLVTAKENFGREENFSAVLITTMSKDMDEQVKLAHKVVHVVDRVQKRFLWLCCGTMWTKQRVFCSSPNVCKEEWGRKFSTMISRDSKNMKNLISALCNETGIWYSKR